MHDARVGTKALALEAGVHPVTVSGWRRGRRPQSPAQFEWLAVRLRVPLRWLRDGEGTKDDRDDGMGYVLREAIAIPGYPSGSADETRSSAAKDAERVAGEIVMRRMAGRTFMPVAEAIEYMAAIADAAAGRPIKLPPVAGTPGQEPPPGQSDTA